MSVRQFSDLGIATRSFATTVPNVSPTSAVWVRHPAWLTMSAPTESEEKFVGLHIVNPESNFVALSATCSAGGDFTVNWGDGVTDTVASGSVAYHEYSYSDADLANTDGPVTFQDSANTVTRNNHGFTDGMRVTFYNIATTTGISEGQIYYVVNAATNTFQVSDTSGGSAINLVSDGSGTLLPYKQAIVQVTPASGQTFTKLDLHKKHNKTNLQQYNSGFVDIAIASSTLYYLTIGSINPGYSAQTIRFGSLEQVNIVKSDLRNLGRLFLNCYSLRSIVNLNTSATAARTESVTFTDAGDLVTLNNHGLRDGEAVIFTSVTTTTGITLNYYYIVSNATTNTFTLTTVDGSASALTNDGSGIVVIGTVMSNMFLNCYALTTVPLFNTAAVIDMNSMFFACYALTSVPLFNTASVKTMSSMFNSCYKLTSVPLFNTAAVTNMSAMFGYCYSLTSVPLFNAAAVTDISIMFRDCYSLTSVPPFNTAAATNMSNMFTNCFSLTSVSLFNTAAATNMSNMFSSCYVLTSVPLFNTAAVTNMSGMFSNCYVLTSVPVFNTTAVTNMSSMFANCQALTSVPLLNTSKVTAMSGMFSGCFSLTSVPLFNTAAVTNMSNMFNSCISLTSVPLFNTAAVTNMSSMFVACYALTSVPLFNTAAVTNISSMFTNCYSLTSVNLSSANGATSSSAYSNMFSTCPSLSKIKTVNFKYTFSVASCDLSAAALNELYTNLATVTGQTITVTGNHGTDADDPTIATAKGWTVTG